MTPAAEFIDKRMASVFASLADANQLVMVVLNSVILLATPLAANPSNVPFVSGVCLVTIASSLVYFALRPRPKAACAYVFAQNALFATVFAALTRRALENGWTEMAAIPYSVQLSVSIFIIFGVPYERWPRFGMTAFLCLLAFWATGVDWPTHHREAIILSVAFIVTGALSYLFIETTRLYTAQEVLERLQVAPAELVRSSLDAKGALDEFLAPSPARVLCLASDWRGFQKLAKAMSPERLAESLEDYYDACREILRARLGERQYFVDWIADELLVTVLVPPGEEAAVASEALAFAEDVLAMKRRYNAARGLRIGVDFGLSLGDAVVGLMGPRTHRKVMAVGAPVVRARRLQSLAKELRDGRTGADRIVYDATVGEVVHPEQPPEAVRCLEAA